ncbi:anthranilate synthase component I family protein [Microbacterium sp. MYb62]|uniref:anthranilate synthase component I family protein n=1 Tax=Microbacterium sp. MYb62 TaxID=1848690 RepID=UPI000CFBF587|nr:anthranilate synthase component I family protein [Microbacterium sp. MYb62]PRB09820.1 metal ABC transporter ATP-binding protein [Microbacterium sp. MYb62]
MPEPLSRRLLPQWVEPSTVFRMLESRSSDVFWLDAGAQATEGWSFVGTGRRSSLPAHVRLDVAPVDPSAPLDPSTPPFAGGWVGWLDYESGAAAVGAPVVGVVDPNPGSWLHATRVVAFDHSLRRTWALGIDDDLESWAAEVISLSGARGDAVTVGAAVGVEGVSRVAEARHDPREYAALIERCRDLIRAGIAYQLCLTTRFTVSGPQDAVDVYDRLRSATPAHHGGFVRIGDRTLLSASPEQFLHAAGGIIRTRPIKGTRPRSADPREDAALAAELAVDRKERAENVMIVDLMRNDLSRVSVPGTIRVEGLWIVESYPAVHQLVSTVSGAAAEGITVGALLAAAFPAGSMTGAPKLSAMTRLQELEGGSRGVYAGCFGYIGDDGALDLAMVIRSIVIEGDRAVVGAGGGITWGSVAASEVAEVAMKARAPLAALGAEMPGHWRSDILN